jgi:hypothetical protein
VGLPQAVEDVGGGGGTNQLWLDGIVELESIHTIVNDKPAQAPTDPLKHFFYPLRLQDLQLPLQLPYVALTVFDRGMPKGGASIVYENMMLVGKVTGSSTKELNVDAANTGLGEIRWSDATEISPELFPPLNRYVPTVPSNETIRFERVGDNVIGYANDRLYHIRKESQYVNIEEMHEGYGVTGHRATAALGSLSLFLNHRGVKQVAANGKLDDVRAIDDLVINTWGQTTSNVSVAFDPLAGVVFVYNPTTGTSANFWVNTGIVSELHDLPFHGVRQGVWPSQALTYDDTLVRRALWLQNSPHNPTVAAANEFKPKLFVLDVYREKTISGASSGLANGRPRLRLLDVQQDSVGTVAVEYPGTGALRLEGINYDADGLIGARVYSGRSDQAGLSARVVGVEVDAGEVGGVRYSELTLHPDDDDILDGLVVGDSVMLSPVPVEVVGAPLRMESGGQGFASTFEFVSVRQMETMGISLADVTGPPADLQLLIARWEAQLYEGNQETPTLSIFPTDKRGNEVHSLEEGASNLYAAFGQHGILGTALSPGVRIICPDLDYKLLGYNVTGTIRASVKGEFRP